MQLDSLGAFSHVRDLRAGTISFQAVHTHMPGRLESADVLPPLSKPWLSSWQALCSALPTLKRAEFTLEWPARYPDRCTTFSNSCSCSVTMEIH